MARRVDQPLITDGIIIETEGHISVQDASSLKEIAFYIEFTTGANAGVVKIETARENEYGGTWAVLSTITYAAAPAVQYVAITGIFRAVRARISTAIGGGGAVNVWMAGSQ